MSEDLKEFYTQTMKAQESWKKASKTGWPNKNVAETILEVKSNHEEELRRDFRKDAEAWDRTGKNGECLNDKLWNWFYSNDTLGKNLLNDWDAVPAVLVAHVWSNEINDMARI